MSLAESPRVSVIIPTYKRAHMVARAINSVLAQTFADFELLVIDDCSEDNTEEVVKGIEDARIRYLPRSVNQGASAARNTGIHAARGEYFAFLDSDDQWIPTKLETQLKVFQDTDWPNLGIVMCGYISQDEEGTEEALPSARGGNLYEAFLLHQIGCVTASVILTRRSAWSQPLLFDEDLACGEDWDYLTRASQRAQVDYVSQPLVLLDRCKGDHLTDLKGALMESWRRIREKNYSYLRSRPRLLMLYHQSTLRRHHLYRHRDRIRRDALQALLDFPYHPIPYLWVLGALFGSLTLRLALRVFSLEDKPAEAIETLYRVASRFLCRRPHL
ncbi:MAG: glycosyltransferase family 2 protein [Verrucomicrobia bacterium]|nr:glycosyltransferase family 2 protein [Verrucomicrobiota bacterium]